MRKTKKVVHWRPNKFFRYTGPVLMALAFAWTGIRLLSGSEAAIVPGGGVQLYISPGSSSVIHNQEFNVSVRVNTNGQTINAVRSDIVYPANQLEFIGTSSPCPDPPFGVTAENLPTPGTPTPGSVKIACGSFVGATGDHTIATLRFRALTNSGTAVVSFADTSEALLKSNNSNQLGSTVSGSIALTAPAPTITSITPSNGSSLGGTAVTITGTNFVSAPTVKFGNADATNIVLVNDTTITTTAPPGNPGATAVSVTIGGQTTGKPNGFVYADVTAPSKPGTPAITSNESNKVSLSWTAATDTGGSGIAGYRVYRNDIQLNSSLALNVNYVDVTAQPNASYSYTVAAVDGAGNVGQQSNPVSVTTRYKGDIDGNGTVNLVDLSKLLSNWNKTGALSSDLDGNSIVNLTDLSILLTNWGKS